MRHCSVVGLGVGLGLAFAAALTLSAAPASAKVLITVDKSTQQMDVSVDGVHRWTWPVSTGIARYDTPSGAFHAFRMEADHFSREWDDAPMPHSIFFTPQGHAIHGYLNTRNIGNPASHGCVRLSPSHAAELYALLEQQGVTNATVVLKGDVQIAMAHRSMRTVARDAGASGGAMLARSDASYEEGYGAPSYGYQQPQYQQPRYQYESRQRAEYGRTYNNCPLPPPGFPVPACARASAQVRAEQYPARRYDYAQPQYEPYAPSSFGRSRSSYGY